MNATISVRAFFMIIIKKAYILRKVGDYYPWKQNKKDRELKRYLY